jgi:hypothetical protein
MLDAIAKRYGVLPSYLIEHGDTFDLMVMDVAVGYESMLQDNKKGVVNPGRFNQEDLMERLNKVRGQ